MTKVGWAGAVGKLEDYSWPDSASVDEKKSWYLKVHNAGSGSGVIFGGIANLSGNPSTIFITFRGEEFEVKPGYMLIIYTTNPVPPCSRINPDGQVRFPKEGDFSIELSAGHKDTEYVRDDRKSVLTKVRGVAKAAELSGIVRGFFGPIEGATVTLDGNRTTTDKTGYYEFKKLKVGDYRITVDHYLYEPITEIITLKEGDNYKDFSMSIKLVYKASAIATAVFGGVGVYGAVKKR